MGQIAIIKFLFLTLFLTAVSDASIVDSLSEKTTVPPLVQDALDKKLKAFKDKRIQRCLEEIKEDAEAHVDSTIIQDIYVEVMDSILFPERPQRPEYRGNIELDDTMLMKYYNKK